MTVAHKNLTGTDLHEVKGASSATAGQVPIADGAGAAVFGKLTASSLQTTGNPFGAQLIHLREEQTAGTGSQTSITAAAWTAVLVNTTKTNEVTGASLAASTITLPAGTYYIDATMPFWMASSTGVYAQLRIQNVSLGTTLLNGPSIHWTVGTGSADGTLQATIRGRFTLASTYGIQLQHYKTSTLVIASFMNIGTEVYTDVVIWKVA